MAPEDVLAAQLLCTRLPGHRPAVRAGLDALRRSGESGLLRRLVASGALDPEQARRAEAAVQRALRVRASEAYGALLIDEGHAAAGVRDVVTRLAPAGRDAVGDELVLLGRIDPDRELLARARAAVGFERRLAELVARAQEGPAPWEDDDAPCAVDAVTAILPVPQHEPAPPEPARTPGSSAARHAALAGLETALEGASFCPTAETLLSPVRAAAPARPAAGPAPAEAPASPAWSELRVQQRVDDLEGSGCAGRAMLLGPAAAARLFQSVTGLDIATPIPPPDAVTPAPHGEPRTATPPAVLAAELAKLLPDAPAPAVPASDPALAGAPGIDPAILGVLPTEPAASASRIDPAALEVTLPLPPLLPRSVGVAHGGQSIDLDATIDVPPPDAASARRRTRRLCEEQAAALDLPKPVPPVASSPRRRTRRLCEEHTPGAGTQRAPEGEQPRFRQTKRFRRGVARLEPEEAARFPIPSWVDLTHPLRGQKLGPYRVLGQIGGGAMGTVHLAVDERDPARPLALKTLAADASPDARGRFRRELIANRRVSHPGALRVHDCGDLPTGEGYLAMEFYDGRDLGKLIAAGRRLPAVRALRIALAVQETLIAAHAASVVHRDVKPENILVGEGDETRLLDFGIALVDDVGPGQTGEDESLFRSLEGTVTGTPEYLSPEQAAGLTCGPRSDIYSLGCTLYRMLAGRLPFAATSMLGWITCRLFEDPLPLRAACPETASVPREVHDLLARMLEREPDDRPTDEQVAQALRHLVGWIPAQNSSS